MKQIWFSSTQVVHLQNWTVKAKYIVLKLFWSLNHCLLHQLRKNLAVKVGTLGLLVSLIWPRVSLVNFSTMLHWQLKACYCLQSGNPSHLKTRTNLFNGLKSLDHEWSSAVLYYNATWIFIAVRLYSVIDLNMCLLAEYCLLVSLIQNHFHWKVYCFQPMYVS